MNKEIKDFLFVKKLNVINKKITNLGFKPKFVILTFDPNQVFNEYRGALDIAKYLNIDIIIDELSSKITQDEIIQQVSILNKDSNINGIIIKIPRVYNFNLQTIYNNISIRKDILGLNYDSELFDECATSIETITEYLKIDLDKCQSTIKSEPNNEYSLSMFNWFNRYNHNITITASPIEHNDILINNSTDLSPKFITNQKLLVNLCVNIKLSKENLKNVDHYINITDYNMFYQFTWFLNFYKIINKFYKS